MVPDFAGKGRSGSDEKAEEYDFRNCDTRVSLTTFEVGHNTRAKMGRTVVSYYRVIRVDSAITRRLCRVRQQHKAFRPLLSAALSVLLACCIADLPSLASISQLTAQDPGEGSENPVLANGPTTINAETYPRQDQKQRRAHYLAPLRVATLQSPDCGGAARLGGGGCGGRLATFEFLSGRLPRLGT